MQLSSLVVGFAINVFLTPDRSNRACGVLLFYDASALLLGLSRKVKSV